MTDEKVQAGELAAKITHLLKAYTGDVDRGVRKAVGLTAKEMLAALRGNAPVKSGSTKKLMAMRTVSELERESKIWYVKKPRGSITHLLTDGHKIFVGKTAKPDKRSGRPQLHRKGGVVAAVMDIEGPEKEAVEKLEQRIREVILNAGN